MKAVCYLCKNPSQNSLQTGKKQINTTSKKIRNTYLNLVARVEQQWLKQRRLRGLLALVRAAVAAVPAVHAVNRITGNLFGDKTQPLGTLWRRRREGERYVCIKKDEVKLVMTRFHLLNISALKNIEKSSWQENKVAYLPQVGVVLVVLTRTLLAFLRLVTTWLIIVK